MDDEAGWQCYPAFVMSGPHPSRRQIDHLVMPSGDLEAQAAFYQRLGFRVGARNVHSWGTENRLVQFDGAFLELITLGTTAVPPPHAPQSFSFGAHVGGWIRQHGEGMSMLALASGDSQADAAWFRQAGIGSYAPFHFGRKGKRADGTDTEVAFTLAFAAAASLPDLGFFMCQHHFPENFWNPAFQQHDNTARGISRIVAVHDNPASAIGFLKSYAGGDVKVETAGISSHLANGTLSIWTPELARQELGDDPALWSIGGPHFAAIVFSVGSLAKAELALRSNNVPHRKEGARIVVPSGAAFGIFVVFEEGQR